MVHVPVPVPVRVPVPVTVTVRLLPRVAWLFFCMAILVFVVTLRYVA